ADQAGQSEAAAGFQDAFAGHARSRRHAGRKLFAGGPQQAEKGPEGIGNTQLLGLALGIVELLLVEQGADGELFHAADGNGFLLGEIARHWLGDAPAPWGEAVSVKKPAVWGFCLQASARKGTGLRVLPGHNGGGT